MGLPSTLLTVEPNRVRDLSGLYFANNSVKVEQEIELVSIVPTVTPNMELEMLLSCTCLH